MMYVIPAEAGIQILGLITRAIPSKSLDSRFRGNDHFEISQRFE
jgi:hypothetical protein